MVRQARRGLARGLAKGILTGVVAGSAMVVVTLVLRVSAGIPLPVELASDRLIPTLSISQFNQLAADLGGLVQGKQVAFLSSLVIQFAFGVLGGLALAIGIELGWRTSERPRPDPSVPVLSAMVGTPLMLVWLASLIWLWPVLASNYRSLFLDWSRWASGMGLLLSFGVYGVSLVLARRALVARHVGAGAPEQEPTRASSISRRAVILGGVGLVLAAGGGYLVRFLYRRATFGAFGYDGLQTRGARVDPVTPNDRFYVVTKNLIDPDVVRDQWRLEVGGFVEDPQTYRFDDLAALPSVIQPTTLECISNPVGGHLMSNAIWRGVPLVTLLERARPKVGGVLVVLRAVDGYVHTIPIAKSMDPHTLVAFMMNGVPLPRRHGYPVRVIVPGAFGEVSVKWVESIQIVDHSVQGYYEKQGWRAQVVPTTTRIDRPTMGQRLSLGAGPIDVGGVAFAGDRGIQLVELSTDGGGSWSEASIDTDSSPLAWSLWSFPWQPARPGAYRLLARSVDATGAPQPATDHGPAPSGATGYHAIDVQVD
jgi:DMSO/TMAO reductase YedYZ molybdopterin-dependent catalytic subunit